VTVARAELVRGHRPVVVSDVAVYIALRDRDGRMFEEKNGGCPNVRFRWSRGPVIKPCIFHPHKMSQIRDVTKTYQCYCSKECFLRGWHSLPKYLWGDKDPDINKEPIAEWVEVASTRTYHPTMEDIDRPLRLEIIPLMKDGRDSRAGRMSITTGTVIPTPKEARTRRMISNGGTFNAEWLIQQFKVMNWNVLADVYATESFYPYCEKWALSWTWRKHLILKELKSMAADIITLQEVQKDAYDDWFKPQLAAEGYEGVFQQKKREAVFYHGKYAAEGCATFYKTTRFRRVDKHVIDYDKLAHAEVKNHNGIDNTDKGVQRLTRGNVALGVVLEDLQIKATNSSQASGPSGGHTIFVLNTHILCDPGATDVKLCQAHFLMTSTQQMLGPNKHMPLLICGDFNSTPDSAVYEYLQSGRVRTGHEDLAVDPCGLLKRINAGHQFQMATAYHACNGQEAKYTNYTEDFKGTLDYIWFTSNSLAVLAISQVDDESQLTQETALPSSTRPSDHVSLVATFMFRDTPADNPRHSPEASPQHVSMSVANALGGAHGGLRSEWSPMGQASGMATTVNGGLSQGGWPYANGNGLWGHLGDGTHL